jgi:uncharacterized membrane protein YsdA (DUF1294 family)
MFFLYLYLSLVAVSSVATFALYGFDKRRARTAGRRVPERTLHILALCGGWPGALAGQRLFRHKTSKTSFLIISWLIIFAHIGVVAAVVGTKTW